MGGKSGGDSQTIQKADPWVGQQGYLSGLYEAARTVPIQQPYPYPGVVPPAPATAAAEMATANRALIGSPVQASGLAQNLRTTRGDYLYGGSGFNAAFNAARDTISPAVQGQFEGASRYGGGLAQSEETRQLANAFAGLYGDERGRQMQASAISPVLAESEYGDINRLGAVGAQQEGRGREALADAMSRWQFQQQAPYNRLGFASQVIQGGYPGGTQTNTAPNPESSLAANAIGGATAGYAIGGGLTALGGPYGALIGAGLGLLAS